MSGELPRLEPGERRPLLDDRIDRTRLQRSLRNVSPAIDLAKNAPRLDSSGRKPGVERIHGPARQIDHLIVLGAGRFGATQMDGEGGKGRDTFDDDWRFDRELLSSQASNLAATPSAGGERHHQDCPVANVAQTIGAAGREQLCQDVASHRLGALAFPRPRRRADSEAYRGF